MNRLTIALVKGIAAVANLADDTLHARLLEAADQHIARREDSRDLMHRIAAMRGEEPTPGQIEAQRKSDAAMSLVRDVIALRDWRLNLDCWDENADWQISNAFGFVFTSLAEGDRNILTKLCHIQRMQHRDAYVKNGCAELCWRIDFERDLERALREGDDSEPVLPPDYPTVAYPV